MYIFLGQYLYKFVKIYNYLLFYYNLALSVCLLFLYVSHLLPFSSVNSILNIQTSSLFCCALLVPFSYNYTFFSFFLFGLSSFFLIILLYRHCGLFFFLQSFPLFLSPIITIINLPKKQQLYNYITYICFTQAQMHIYVYIYILLSCIFTIQTLA